jgi:hypothetical protein
MSSQRRLLVLASAALLLAPSRWAEGQAIADSLPPLRLSVVASAPLRATAPPLVPSLALSPVEQGLLVEASAFQPVVPVRMPGGAAASARQQTHRSRGRAVAWGAVAGAAAGTLTGLGVLAMCDSYCDGVRGRGLALHIGVGAVVGGAVGALVHHLRD